MVDFVILFVRPSRSVRPSKVELVTFVAQKAFQRIQVLPRVNNVSAFSGVVTVLTGFPVVNLENLLRRNCHNKILFYS